MLRRFASREHVIFTSISLCYLQNAKHAAEFCLKEAVVFIRKFVVRS